MKIITYNINGIRSAIKKGLFDWIEDHDYDVICLQETKAHSGSVPVLLLNSIGYHHCWHSAKRKGYSGVATFSKIKPRHIEFGMGLEKYDVEGRILRTDFENLTVINCYIPNGSASQVRHNFKLEFLKDFSGWVTKIREEQPRVIVVGDFNIARSLLDVPPDQATTSPSGFRQDERHWLQQWLDEGFIDSFRNQTPAGRSYTWWPPTNPTRTDRGAWRIDYQFVNATLQSSIQNVSHLKNIYYSDHCPVLLEIDDN